MQALVVTFREACSHVSGAGKKHGQHAGAKHNESAYAWTASFGKEKGIETGIGCAGVAESTIGIFQLNVLFPSHISLRTCPTSLVESSSSGGAKCLSVVCSHAKV